MATYYAPTAGVASWNAANWATSSGQATGASGPPTASDDVILDSAAGACTVAITAASVCRSLVCSGFTGTLTQAAVMLSVGTSTAQASNQALVFSTTMTYTPVSSTASILFVSTYTATPQQIDFGNKVIGAISFSGAGSWIFVGHGFTAFDATQAINVANAASTINTNGFNFSTAEIAIAAGSSARTLSFGSSVITLTGVGGAWGMQFGGSGVTISPNTATFVLNSSNPYFVGTGNGGTINWNGASLVCYPPSNNNNIVVSGNNTFANLYLLPTTSGASGHFLQLTGSTTTTLTGNLYSYANPQYGWTITTVSGTASMVVQGTNNWLFNTAVTNVSFSGGTVYMSPSQTLATGATYSSLAVDTFYMDPTSGNDSTTTTPFGWWSVAYTGATGVLPPVATQCTGSVSGHTANLSYVHPGEWQATAGTLYFYGMNGAFQAETLNFSGAGSCTIAGAFTYCPWQTITTGAAAARVLAGDQIRIKGSNDPVSVGNATWNGAGVTVNGTLNNIASSTNTTPIIVTSNNHGLTTSDFVQIVGHGTNTNANGFFAISAVATNTFTLTGSVGNGVGGATGYWQKATAKAVVLAGAQTSLIYDQGLAWTALNGSTMGLPAIGASSPPAANPAITKSGWSCVSIANSATTAGSQLSYYNLPSTTDYSLYNAITFWIRTSAGISATGLVVQLCTGSGGSTVVDTFVVPALQSAVYNGQFWTPVTLTRVGGGSLHAGINSVALAVGSGGQATITTYLCNINACQATGLSLTSLITKNGANQGGSEAWYPIASIVGTNVILDAGGGYSAGAYQSPSSTGMGYYGASASGIATYVRTGYLTTVPASAITYLASVGKAGVAGYPITYSGGWDSGTNLQTHETLFDGQASQGYGLGGTSYGYITLNHLSFARYFYAIYWNTAVDGLSIKNVQTICGCSVAMALTDGANHGVTLNSIYGLVSNYCPGTFSVAYIPRNSTIDYIEAKSNGISQSTTAFGISLLGNCTVTSGVTVQNNAFNGITFVDGNTFVNNLVSAHNVTTGVTGTTVQGRHITLNNAQISDTWLTSSIPTWLADTNQSWVYCTNYQSAANSHYYFTDGGIVQSNAVTVHTSPGISWQFTPSSTRVNSSTIFYPLEKEIAQVAVAANTAVTVSIYCQLSSTANVGAALVIKAGQLTGVNNGSVNGVLQDLVSTCTSATWQLLTLTFTPTQAGVVSIIGRAWYVAAAGSAYFDDISVSQV